MQHSSFRGVGRHVLRDRTVTVTLRWFSHCHYVSARAHVMAPYRDITSCH